jgi:hypothetical protein
MLKNNNFTDKVNSELQNYRKCNKRFCWKSSYIACHIAADFMNVTTLSAREVNTVKYVKYNPVK